MSKFLSVISIISASYNDFAQTSYPLKIRLFILSLNVRIYNINKVLNSYRILINLVFLETKRYYEK